MLRCADLHAGELGACGCCIVAADIGRTLCIELAAGSTGLIFGCAVEGLASRCEALFLRTCDEGAIPHAAAKGIVGAACKPISLPAKDNPVNPCKCDDNKRESEDKS